MFISPSVLEVHFFGRRTSHSLLEHNSELPNYQWIIYEEKWPALNVAVLIGSYATRRPNGPRKLVISGSPASMPLYKEACT